jgi:hypothetical protein
MVVAKRVGGGVVVAHGFGGVASTNKSAFGRVQSLFQAYQYPICNSLLSMTNAS